MSNAQRMMLSEEVEEAIEQAGDNEALRVLEAAYSIQTREQRPMTLEEALIVIRKISAEIEALGV